MRLELRGLLAAALVAVQPGLAAAQESGLAAASARFPALVSGPIVRSADGSGSFARPCPASGAKVEQRGGPTITYDGADPATPELCHMRFDGQAAEAWFGIWLTNWPGADRASAAIKRLLQGRTGDTEGFVVRMTPERTYYDILRNEGIEQLSLLGRTYQTIKISHYREGASPNTYRSVVTGWKDVATGMLVYVTYQHISGAPETGTPLDPTAITPAQ